MVSNMESEFRGQSHCQQGLYFFASKRPILRDSWSHASRTLREQIYGHNPGTRSDIRSEERRVSDQGKIAGVLAPKDISITGWKAYKRFADGIHNISGWLYLLETSSYDKKQLEFKNRLWFDVVDPSNIIDFINDVDSNEFLFRENEMQELVDFFGGYEFDAKKMRVVDIEKTGEAGKTTKKPVIPQIY